MNLRNYREEQCDTERSFLDSVEGAISEKWRSGRADKGRYGFAAVVANATPPANVAFERALRRRILVEMAKNDNRIRDSKRARLGRFALAGSLAAAVLILALVILLGLRGQKPGEQTAEGTHPAASAPQLAHQDLDALVKRLNEAPATRTVVVYPAEYAGVLAEQVQHKVVPLLVQSDAAPEAMQMELGTILPPSGFVDVVMVSQGASEMAGPVQVALETELYRLYRAGQPVTEFFGVLERSSFVAGPGDVALDPVGAVFEGGVELVAAGVLDDPQPGEPLRLAFDWRVAEPVSDSLVMFVHLIQKNDRLVAQRDAVPGNGLFPVESWEPGVPVRDQFALGLPAELPAGEYEIQVGIYSATSGQRYRLMEPENESHVIIFRLTIADKHQTL